MDTVELDEVQSVSLEDVLAAWELSQYQANFLNNEFTVADLYILSEDINEATLKELIPIGSHRLRFKVNCRALKAAADVEVDEVNVISSGGSGIISEAVSKTLTPKTVQEPQAQSSNSDSDDLPLKDMNMNVITQSPKRTNPNVLPLSPTGADRRLKRPSVESVRSESSQKKRPTPAENSSCFDGEELRALLKRTGTGRILLALAQKTSSLKYEKDQNKLTEIIIENKILNSSNFKIKSDEFPEIVKSIQSLFPGEEEATYFIPYRNSEGSQKCQAKGKLVSKYYTLRKEMTAAGIISKKRDDVDSDDDDPSPVIEGAQEKLQFLQENINPWDKVLQFWKETARLRLSSIQKLLKSKPKKGASKRARGGNDNTESEEVGDVDTTVTSYIATYPALRSKEGYTLFESDFAHLYPHHTLRIYSEFDDFSTQALKALNSIERKPKALENNLEILEDGNLSDEAKHLIVLLSLCYLDNVVTVTRTKRDKKVLSWRPPQPEIQEGFITHVETPGRADFFISKRYEKFASWGLPVQPFVVVCGPSVEEIDDCFVVLSKTVKFNGIQSVRRALDICFKIIHAVNAEYSCESHRLWMLIQKRLYKLDTKVDNVRNDAQLPNVLKRFDC
ncbi:hypothetical protein ONE63_005069 [Megalurothrips usitatus]|uniref:SAM domain-containing protein n=1 Tax=Megalurothrips usitatus TaxID=439358 RepID=A0AAV7X5W2_9NEOP|nr:hypothetical protein ONE63_005069 [Megalurothrips usitatus]